MDKIQLGDVVRQARQSKAMSCQRVANLMVGKNGGKLVNQQVVSRFEEGRYNITINNLLALCEVLDIELVIQKKK